MSSDSRTRLFHKERPAFERRFRRRIPETILNLRSKSSPLQSVNLGYSQVDYLVSAACENAMFAEQTATISRDGNGFVGVDQSAGNQRPWFGMMLLAIEKFDDGIELIGLGCPDQ